MNYKKTILKNGLRVIAVPMILYADLTKISKSYIMVIY